MLTLPGYQGDQASLPESWQLDNLLESFEQLPIPAAIWCGWSLGGMLAALFAARYPGRVNALVTLAANAHFVQCDGWTQAMPPADAEQFSASLKANASVTLKRFLALICQGSETAKADLRLLKQCAGSADSETLVASLALLYQLDTRQTLASLSLPQCHLLGEHDALVPSTVKEPLQQLNSASFVTVLEGASHALLVSHSERVAQMLLQQVAS